MDELTQYREAMKALERLYKRLPPEKFDHNAVYIRVRDTELKRHRSVKLVHELTGEEPEGNQELFNYLGYPDAEPVPFEHDDVLVYDNSNRNASGGFVMAAKIKGQERQAYFVFLSNGPQPIQSDTEADATAGKYLFFIMILMHEMGHIDDLERLTIPCSCNRNVRTSHEHLLPLRPATPRRWRPAAPRPSAPSTTARST